MAKLFKEDQNCDYHYTTWLNLLVNLISPKVFIGILGRATGKTTDMLADRLVEVMYDMPGAYGAFAADTYTHAIVDMIPPLLDGLKKKGLHEGRDYVTDKKPPDHFKKPYKSPISYKHTISFANGFFVKIVSMDEPSSMAGDSYQHLFSDELKYINFEVIKKLFPAIRGEYLTFSKSPFYRGMSATSDMPNIADKKEFDWFMDREKDMNSDQLFLIYQTALTLNDYKIQYTRAFAKQNHQKMKVLQKRIVDWEARWVALRKNSTLFLVASSFVNADILRTEFFVDTLKDLKMTEFKSSVLSFKPEMDQGDKFYVNLGYHHYYKDGVKNNFYDKYKLTDSILPSSESLRYIDANKPVEAGVDFGNMCSMVTGQQHGEYIYALKEFYTLPPSHLKELAGQYKSFFRNHKKKELLLFYDRSGNQYGKVQKDFASELKRYIEFDEFGISSGWSVKLMSLNQRNIYQSEEYQFMLNLLGETQPKLPKLKIDKFMCKCLVSSLNLAKLKIDKKNGQTVIKKDKSSEKLPLERLPEYSTNFSDAFKYWLSRSDWMKIGSNKPLLKFDQPSVF